MKTLLTISLVFLSVGFAAWFFYWRLLRPVVLARLRYAIFAARDRLRMLVINGEIKEKNEAVGIIEQRCNGCLWMLPETDLMELHAFKPDKEILLRAERDFEIIKSSDPAVREIHRTILNSLMGALLLNTPGIFPIAAGALLFAFWSNSVKRFLTNVQELAWGLTYQLRPVPAGVRNHR